MTIDTKFLATMWAWASRGSPYDIFTMRDGFKMIGIHTIMFST